MTVKMKEKQPHNNTYLKGGGRVPKTVLWYKSHPSGSRKPYLQAKTNSIANLELYTSIQVQCWLTVLCFEIRHSLNPRTVTYKFFNWTGTTSLGSYCVSATSSHYDWAMKKIKKTQKRTK